MYIYIYSFNYTLVREHPIAFFKSLKLKEIEKMEYLIKAKQCDVSNRVFVLFWCGLEVWKWCDRMKQNTKCLRTTLLVLFFIPKGRLAFHRCDPSMVAEVNLEPPRLALRQRAHTNIMQHVGT